MYKQEKDTLINYMIKQAEYFLKQFGEFYPFGYIINENNEIKPVSLPLEEENPSPIDIITILENAYREGIQQGVYKMTGICVDVRVTPPHKEEKMDALEIRINNSNNEKENWYVPYKLLGNQIVFSTAYSMNAE